MACLGEPSAPHHSKVNTTPQISPVLVGAKDGPTSLRIASFSSKKKRSSSHQCQMHCMDVALANYCNVCLVKSACTLHMSCNFANSVESKRSRAKMPKMRPTCVQTVSTKRDACITTAAFWGATICFFLLYNSYTNCNIITFCFGKASYDMRRLLFFPQSVHYK